MTRQPPTSRAADPSPSDSAEPRAQTNFWLTEYELELVDRWEYQLRRGGWRTVTRSAIMRCMLACLRDLPVEVTRIGSEQQLAAHFRALLEQHSE